MGEQEVLLFEEPNLGPEPEVGYPYQSDASGVFEHHWGWLGGGGDYTVRLIAEDGTHVAADTTMTFAVRGTKEDNHLDWLIRLQRATAPSP